jgi:hypothetical protein
MSPDGCAGATVHFPARRAKDSIASDVIRRE